MASVSAQTGSFRLVAYRGDRKTLLAFDLAQADADRLAGFTIQYQPPSGPAYYVFNTLQFAHPGDHAQDAAEPPYSSINAPIHKFRWAHVPGQNHQGLDPQTGPYAYTVTPRYFDASNTLLPLDPTRSASLTIDLDGFGKGQLKLGFTRGYVQSQAYVNHFGKTATIRPAGKGLIYDTSAQAGQNAAGATYTYQDEYRWLGFTARELVLDVLNTAIATPGQTLDVFAYDFDEPDLVTQMQTLAGQGRLRIILDNSSEHHNATGTQAEDQAAALLEGAKAGSVKRGKFGRFAHSKVIVVHEGGAATQVLTGSTNFAITGLYVNSNHVLVFDDPEVAGWYADVFEEAWNDNVSEAKFTASSWANQTFTSTDAATPATSITFSPHTPAMETQVLSGLVARVGQEDAAPAGEGSVLFAVMELGGTNTVYDALNQLHADQTIFSYGISDDPKGVFLYPIGGKTGVLVSGKPGKTALPAPFNQLAGIGGDHQVHHKFVVCGFNRPDAVVYCGSSNLAEGGEKENGDNLLAIHDTDVATVFAIEALLLVDHFDFLDSQPAKPASPPPPSPPAPPAPVSAAAAATWYLGVTDAWAKKYFDPADLHSIDRQLFAQG